MPWRGPAYPGELPTLGWSVVDWIETYLRVPDGPTAGDPMRLTREQVQFILDLYALDPGLGRRRVRRAVLSRPKGWGKSPFLAALCLVEALGDVVPDGWDASGEPVGRAWTSLGFRALVQVAAVSEEQTANTWGPLLEMARGPELLDHYAIEPLEGFVNLPRGRIDFRTASATSAEGYRPVFEVMDQTESWSASNGGHRLAAAIRRNLAKTGGCSVETPNSFRRGELSVAELSHEAWTAQQLGKLRGRDGGILFDHREAPAGTDLADAESLLAGLAYAYGCSAHRPGIGCAVHGPGCADGWADLERILDEIWDPATEPSDARVYYLNQSDAAEDAWTTPAAWGARLDPDRALQPGDTITLGFDGSRGRRKGVADATALVAVRVEDGHAELIRAWEQPEGPAGKGWTVPAEQVVATVADTFAAYRVVGFYADPAGWTVEVAAWEAKHRARLKVYAGGKTHPVAWWINQGRATAVARSIAALEEAVKGGPLTHRGQPVLTQHVVNARRDPRPQGVWLRKEHPDSTRKVDAAWALVLAWQARLDVVAARKGGSGYTPRQRSTVRR